MTENVVPFTGLTKLPLTPDKMLEAVAKNKPDECVIITMENGKLGLYGSMADLQRVLWLIKKTETDILNGRY